MLCAVAGCDGSSRDAGDPSSAGDLRNVKDALSEQDSDAIAQLAEIAARDAQPGGPAEATKCWAPSQNLLSDDAGADASGFRVLCRVHFSQEGAERYRDMICIGQLGRDPVAEYCYEWAFYADAPRFEDHPAFAAPALG